MKFIFIFKHGLISTIDYVMYERKENKAKVFVGSSEFGVICCFRFGSVAGWALANSKDVKTKDWNLNCYSDGR
jgi:hypothetical protein